MEAARRRFLLAAAFLCCSYDPAGAAQEQGSSSPVAGLQPFEPGTILRGFHTYHIKSKTIYMKREVLLKACLERPEFSAWRLTPTDDPASAEVIFEIALPFLTWEWNYKMLDRASGSLLGSGKVSALEQHQAAPLLAADLVKTIAAAREIPEVPKPQPAVQNKVAGLKSWHVKGKTAPATMAIGENAVYISDSSGKQLEISSRRILSAYHFVAQDVQREERLKKWNAAMESGLGRACAFPFEESGPVDEGCPYIWIGLPIWLMGEGILRIPTEPARHFIAIQWQDEQSVIGISAEVDARDWKEILRGLESSVRKGQQELGIEVLADPGPLRQQFETARQGGKIIFFDVPVNIGRWPPLGPGEFRVIVLKRSNARAEVLFFDTADLAFDKPRAVAVGHIERIGNKMPGIAARVREENGLKLLNEIRYENILLRFD